MSRAMALPVRSGGRGGSRRPSTWCAEARSWVVGLLHGAELFLVDLDEALQLLDHRRRVVLLRGDEGRQARELRRGDSSAGAVVDDQGAEVGDRRASIDALRVHAVEQLVRQVALEPG